MHLIFFHVFSWLGSSFIFRAKQYSIVWMDHNSCIRSPPEGHFGFFHLVLAIVNKAAIICVQVFVWTYIFSSFRQITRRTITGLHGKSVFSFVRICQTHILPQGLYHLAFTAATNQHSCWYTSLPAFGVVSGPDLGHSSRCVEVANRCFNLHFPDALQRGASFPMLICHLYTFSGDISRKSSSSILSFRASAFGVAAKKSSQT